MGKRIHLCDYSLLFSMLSLFLMSASTLLAQDTTPRIITTGWAGNQQIISSDSQYFIHRYKDWISYNVTTSTETHSEAFPISNPLSTIEHGLFENSLQTNIFESPDHRYIAYSTLSKLDGRQKLAIGDRKLLQKHIFMEFNVLSPNALDSFNVNWSMDSNALLVTGQTDEGAQAYYAYISNFSTDLSTAKLYDFTFTADTSDPNIMIQNAFALTQDGQSALLLAAISDPKQPTQSITHMEHKLAIWNAKNPDTDNIQLLDNIDVSEIINASFAHDNDNHLLVVTYTAFIDYDLTTQRQQTLQFPFELAQVESLLFAPNGEYLITTIMNDRSSATDLVPLPLPIKKA